ncbi:hypothetical protein RUM44_008755 [Polyplax serrata]|uniref:Uncharacterized protein n=1 Tax=Polyplax serrata TaxID=468196 RepID=A0ABR1B968_POLSC
MDILELSKKLEGDLLNSKENNLCANNSCGIPYSPRTTRSKLHPKSMLKEDAKVSNIKGSSESTNSSNLNKKTRMTNKNLETIYENPVWKKGNVMLIGTSKVKRSIYLDREFRRTSKTKSKLRKIKIKKLGKKFKPLKMSDDEFQNKMLQIENYINDRDVSFNHNNEGCDIDVQMDDNKNKTNPVLFTINEKSLKEADESINLDISDVQMESQ